MDPAALYPPAASLYTLFWRPTQLTGNVTGASEKTISSAPVCGVADTRHTPHHTRHIPRNRPSTPSPTYSTGAQPKPRLGIQGKARLRGPFTLSGRRERRAKLKLRMKPALNRAYTSTSGDDGAARGARGT